MDRQSIIASLIWFDRPLSDLTRELRELSWDWDAAPVAILGRQNISTVIDRFLAAELSAEAVETWANLLEGREDIAFEPGHATNVAEALHDLANPELSGRLDAIAADVRVRLTACRK